MFTISEATEDNLPLIRAIAEKTWWPTYSPFLQREQIRYMLDTIYGEDMMREAMASRSQTFIILRDENGPQGFAAFGPRPEDPQVYKLHKLYVLPTVQQKGCGRALIRYITNRLLQENIHTLDLNVNRSNPARWFYEKAGFRILREEDIPIGPFWMNDYVMRMEF